VQLQFEPGWTSVLASVFVFAICGPQAYAENSLDEKDGVLNHGLIQDISGALGKKTSVTRADELAACQNWAAAYELYTKEINRRKDDAVPPRMKRMICAARMKRWKDVIADADAILKSKEPGPQKRAKVMQRRGQAYAELKQYKLACQDLEQVIKIWPDYRQAYVELIQIYQQTGNVQGEKATQKKLDALDSELKPF
jgi:tetratricopeptide (TPR) repeat protein